MINIDRITTSCICKDVVLKLVVTINRGTRLVKSPVTGTTSGHVNTVVVDVLIVAAIGIKRITRSAASHVDEVIADQSTTTGSAVTVVKIKAVISCSYIDTVVQYLDRIV